MSARFDNIDAEYIRRLLDSGPISRKAFAYRRQLERYCNAPGVSGITELQRSNNVLFQWKKHVITELSRSNLLSITFASAFARLSKWLHEEKAGLKKSESTTATTEPSGPRPPQPDSVIIDVNQIETESTVERTSAARSENNSAVCNMRGAKLAIIEYCMGIIGEMGESALEKLISGDDVPSVDNSYLSLVMCGIGIGIGIRTGDLCEDQDDFIKFSILYFMDQMIFDVADGEFGLPVLPECRLVGALAVYGMKMAHLMEQSHNSLVITRLYEQGWMHKKLSDFEIGEIVRLALIAAIDIDVSTDTEGISFFLSIMRSMEWLSPTLEFGNITVSMPVISATMSYARQLAMLFLGFVVTLAYGSFQFTGGIILVIQFAFLPLTRFLVRNLLLLRQMYRLAYSLLNGHGAADIERNGYDIRDTMRRISEADRIALESMFGMFFNYLMGIFESETHSDTHSDLPSVGEWMGLEISANSENVNAVAAHILEELNFFDIPWGEFKRAVLKSGAAMIFRMDALPFNGASTRYVRASTESHGGKVYTVVEKN